MRKKIAITDLNVPNGSRDILSQSQDFEQAGSRYVVGFRPHFHINMTSQPQSGRKKKKEKMKVEYFRSLSFDLFKILQAVRTQQRISFFKIRCYGNLKCLFRYITSAF